MIQATSPHEEQRYGKNWENKQWKAKVHALTKGVCACCHRERSQEIHHLWYRRDDGTLVRDSEVAGVDVIPLCQSCHGIAHRRENWTIDRQDPALGNRNTAEYRRFLQQRCNLLVQGKRSPLPQSKRRSTRVRQTSQWVELAWMLLPVAVAIACVLVLK